MIGTDYLETTPLTALVVNAVAMIPVAGLIGEATESIAANVGSRLSGLLNATFGIAAELTITIVAIREGLLELVKASIRGSILGSLLFVLGLSMLVGGVKNGVQRFERDKASSDTLLLLLAVIALVIPSLFSQVGHGNHADLDVEILSLGVAGLMIIIYALGLLFGFRLDRGPLTRSSAELVVHHKAWPVRKGILILLASTAVVVWGGEILVMNIETATV